MQGDAILRLLRSHSCLESLPKTTRTLLQTPREPTELRTVDPGEYLHLGLIQALTLMLDGINPEDIPNHLLVDFSTDGASLDKTPAGTIWPIQVIIANIPGCKPEVVGIYRGIEKPADAHDFFHDFLTDVDAVKAAGGIVYKNRHIAVSLRCFIADAPARAFILNHIGHTGKVPCSKCKIAAHSCSDDPKKKKRQALLGVNWPPRTDEEYAQADDGSHHNDGESCLKNYIPLVTNVPFDIQHLTFLGLVDKFLSAIISGDFKRSVKMTRAQLSMAENRISIISHYCPRDFSRHPKSFKKYSKFKATENRQILLYTGIVIFSGIIDKEAYDHFFMNACVYTSFCS